MFTNWRKSSKSLHNPNQCVEVGFTSDGELVGVRDTKDRGSGMLTIDHKRWASFLAAVKKEI